MFEGLRNECSREWFCKEIIPFADTRSRWKKFQDLFEKIMYYFEQDFVSIKPWGNIGDRKNDGYIRSKGIFYQVYAPEELETKYYEAAKKAREDFSGLKKNREDIGDINEYHFVVNDKYKGVHPDIYRCIEGIRTDNNLRDASVIQAKDLENILFDHLTEDQIYSIVSYPNFNDMTRLEYSIISEVIKYLSEQPPKPTGDERLTVPPWEEKMLFNGLAGSDAETLLESSFLYVSQLDYYLRNLAEFNSTKLRDEVQKKYRQLCDEYSGRDLFWALVYSVAPKNDKNYVAHVIVILAKYFETCDVFEEPTC